MCIRPRGPAASAPALRTVSRAVPAAPASMGAAATHSASRRITLATALYRSGATTVSSTWPPPASLPTSVPVSIVLTKLEMVFAMRSATAMPASGMEVTVLSPWRTPGPTAPPHCLAGITSTTSVMSYVTLPSAYLTTLNAKGTARLASKGTEFYRS